MSDNMVERVARAIEFELDRDFEAWVERWGTPAGICDDAPNPPSRYKTSPQRIARAAIKEMQNPTRPMLRAAARAMLPKYRPTPDHVPCKEKHRIRYRAMIEAALSEDSQ